MKLSELVNYFNLLDSVSTTQIKYTTQQELEKILYVVKNKEVNFETLSKSLDTKQQQISSIFDEFEQDLVAIKTNLKELITQMEKPWFAESYRLYDQEMNNETIDDIRNRRPTLPPEVENFYCSRISRYQGWHHPAMIIRPGFETYINHMVSCDPLYLVDVKHELLRPALDQYNELYQSRLRLYTINERDDQEILQRLPDQQFGLILVYNFFNFRPLELIKKYLNEMYHKLRPGGTLIITINDCDRDKGVALVERRFCCYTPGFLIKELAKSIGYEIEFSWHNDGPSTWIELRKPGEFVTLRGGQTLAKILPKPVA